MRHQTSRLLLNNTKLNRGQKRRAAGQCNQPEKNQPRGRASEYVLCEKEASAYELSLMMTVHLKERLHEWRKTFGYCTGVQVPCCMLRTTKRQQQYEGSTNPDKGKKTAWQTLDVCNKASDVFSKLSQCLPAKDSAADGVDDTRLTVFAQSHPSYSSCSIPACRACCLPGRSECI